MPRSLSSPLRSPSGSICPVGTAANTKPESHKRMVIIDQDAFGPAGSTCRRFCCCCRQATSRCSASHRQRRWLARRRGRSHAAAARDRRTDATCRSFPARCCPLANSAARTQSVGKSLRQAGLQGRLDGNLAGPECQRRTPHPSDPYLLPPSPAGAPHIKAAADIAANFLIRTAPAIRAR